MKFSFLCIMFLSASPWDLLYTVDILSIFVSKKDVSLNLEYLTLGILRFQLSNSQLSSPPALIFPFLSAQNFKSWLRQFKHASFLQPGICGMPVQLVPHPYVLEFLAQMSMHTARQTVTQLSVCIQKRLRISSPKLKLKIFILLSQWSIFVGSAIKSKMNQLQKIFCNLNKWRFFTYECVKSVLYRMLHCIHMCVLFYNEMIYFFRESLAHLEASSFQNQASSC